MITGAIHTVFILFLFLYGIIFNRSKWDSLFLLATYAIVLHWTFYNGECVVSYLEKIKNDPNYKAGTDVFDLKDVSFLGFDPSIFRIVLNLLLLVWFYSVFIVLKRNRYPYTFIIPFISLFLFYNVILRWFYKNYDDMLFQTLQRVCMVGLIALGIYAGVLIYKKKVLYI